MNILKELFSVNEFRYSMLTLCFSIGFSIALYQVCKIGDIGNNFLMLLVTLIGGITGVNITNLATNKNISNNTNNTNNISQQQNNSVRSNINARI